MRFPRFPSLFKRSKRNAGLASIVVRRDGVYVVRLQRTPALLQVALCEFFPLHQVTAMALERLVKEQRLGGSRFTTLLAPDEYQILMVEAPDVPEDEMKMAIRYQIKDSLNYPVDEVMVDAVRIPGGRNAAARPHIYAVAAANDVLQKHVSLFEDAGLELVAIDIPEMAQRNLAALYETPGQALVLLVFDDTGGLLTFTCDGELYLSRRLEISAGQLQDADEQYRQQNQDRVELEVQRSLDYFEQQFHQLAVNRVLVAAPSVADEALVRQLSVSLDFPVATLDLAAGIDISLVPGLRDGGSLTAALLPIGAALREEGTAK